jgi:transposase
MRDTTLMQQALGLTPPWTVVRSDFDTKPGRLDVEIDFTPGSRFACPNCGAADCPAYDTQRKTWRHLNFFQPQAYLNARVPRVRCETCGIRQVNVPWARPDSGFTLLFEAMVMTMVWAMPVKAVARIVGEHDTRLWRVVHHYVDAGRARTDASEVTRVAIAKPPPGAAMITSRCSSISIRRGCCLPPRARMPPPSPHLPMTLPRMAVSPRRSRRSAST